MTVKKVTREDFVNRIVELTEERKVLDDLIGTEKDKLLTSMTENDVELVETDTGRAVVVAGTTVTIDIAELDALLTPSQRRKIRTSGVIVERVSVPEFRDAVLRGEIDMAVANEVAEEKPISTYVKVTPRKGEPATKPAPASTKSRKVVARKPKRS